jgi:hypothetical protein
VEMAWRIDNYIENIWLSVKAKRIKVDDGNVDFYCDGDNGLS